jgi:hypothetical protein
LRHGVELHSIEEVGGVLIDLQQVQERLRRGSGVATPEEAVVAALREAAENLPGPHRKIVEIVLALDPDYRGMTAQARRELAGKEFRGGARPVSGETIRQYHERQAIQMLADQLLERERDIRLRRSLVGSDSAKSVAPAPLTCFVIGPIGNRHAALGSPDRQTYEDALTLMEDVVRPACDAMGLTPVRADDLARAGEITEQIFRRLRDDDVVIADLTDANPNVMYELGLRHTQEKLTIQIGEYGRLPFDISTIRTIQFSRSAVGLIKARDELIRVLEAGTAGGYDPVTATRVWTASKTLAPEDEKAVNERAEPEEVDLEEPRFLDVMAEAEEHQEALGPAVVAVGACITDLAELAQQSASETQRSDAAGKGMRGRLQIATRYAQGMNSIADQLETAVDNYVSVLGSFSAGTNMLIGRMEADEKALADGQDFGKITRRLATVTRTSLGQLAEMVDSMKQVAQISRVLKEPTSRLTAALERFTKATAIIDDWDRRLQSLGVPLPPEDWQPADAPAAEPSAGPAGMIGR